MKHVFVFNNYHMHLLKEKKLVFNIQLNLKETFYYFFIYFHCKLDF